MAAHLPASHRSPAIAHRFVAMTASALLATALAVAVAAVAVVTLGVWNDHAGSADASISVPRTVPAESATTLPSSGLQHLSLLVTGAVLLGLGLAVLAGARRTRSMR